MKGFSCPMIDYQCWGKRCAWWDEKEGACAVVGLLKSNRRLEEQLEEWNAAKRAALKKDAHTKISMKKPRTAENNR